MEELMVFLNAHYILNSIACTLFLLSKAIQPVCSLLYQLDEEGNCGLDRRDTEILMFLCFVMLLKNRRLKSRAVKEYIANIFLFGKCANLLLFFRHDIRWGVFYGIICLLLFLVFPEPSYTGPDRVTFFRGQALDEELLHNPHKVWLVEFYATWSPPCSRFSSIFASLSLKYDNELFKFGKLDVTRYPIIAKKYKVDSSVTSKNLPTLILFKDGKEFMRRPKVDSKGGVTNYIFREEGIIADFNMNEIYKNTKERLKNKNKKND